MNKRTVMTKRVPKKQQKTLAEWLGGTVHIKGNAIELIDPQWPKSRYFSRKTCESISRK